MILYNDRSLDESYMVKSYTNFETDEEDEKPSVAAEILSHNWRLKHNTGETPYVGITKDTCDIDQKIVRGKNIILVDDVYTPGVYVVEDCIQALFDCGAKDVILYVIARVV